MGHPFCWQISCAFCFSLLIESSKHLSTQLWSNWWSSTAVCPGLSWFYHWKFCSLGNLSVVGTLAWLVTGFCAEPWAPREVNWMYPCLWGGGRVGGWEEGDLWINTLRYNTLSAGRDHSQPNTVVWGWGWAQGGIPGGSTLCTECLELGRQRLRVRGEKETALFFSQLPPDSQPQF